MTFAKKLSEACVQIWCELVKKEEWRRLEEIRLEEHPGLQKLKDSDSKDIFIAERQRVRIDVKGNSFFGNEVPKYSLLMTFFPIAKDNHIFRHFKRKWVCMVLLFLLLLTQWIKAEKQFYTR